MPIDPTMTPDALRAFFAVYLDEPGGWDAYELADAIERSEAPMADVHAALAPIGGLDARDRPGPSGMTALMTMCAVGYDPSTVARLLDHADPRQHRIDPSTGKPCSPMGYAARHHHWALVEVLEQHGIDPAAPLLNGRNVLHLATVAGAVHVVQRLLDQGLDPMQVENNGFSALDLALQATGPGHEPVVMALLEALPDLSGWISPYGWPWKNAAGASETVVRALVARGVPINAGSGDGRCVLPERLRWVPQRFRISSTTWPDERAALRAMVELGADANARDQQGKNALGYAIGLDGLNLDLLTLLVDAGADLDAPVIPGQDRSLRDQLVLNVGREEVVQGLLERHDLRKVAQESQNAQNVDRTVRSRSRL